MYAVWLNVLPGDSRAAWDSRWLRDVRVTQFWDEQSVTGKWFAQKVSQSWGGPIYDVFFLYGPDARWEADAEPWPIESRGRTILGRRALLESTLQPLLNGGADGGAPPPGS